MNKQTQTGTKEALLQKVVDGYVLGAIPLCPRCRTGKLRFNSSLGEYTCPGYVDGYSKIDCGSIFT